MNKSNRLNYDLTDAGTWFETPAAAQFFLKVFREAKKKDCDSVNIQYDKDEKILLSFLKDKESIDTSDFACSQAFWNNICQSFEYRSASWPKAGDRDWDSSDLKTQRILYKLSASEVITAELSLHTQVKGGTPALYVKDIALLKGNALKNLFIPSAYNRTTFTQIENTTHGIIIAENDDDSSQVSAFSVCAALQPTARFITFPYTVEHIRKIVSLADEQTVIIGYGGDDPIESIFEIAHIAREDKELLASFYKKLVASVALQQVRRSCSNCSRLTALSSDLTQELPEVFRPDAGFEYMFGRGCDTCGHAAYHGKVNLESSILLDDELHELMLKGATAAQVTELAYRKGSRSLLEDGLMKIEEQMTTFEEVVKGVSRISTGFLAAATHRADKGLESPGDAAVRDELAALDEDYFFDNNKSKQTQSTLLVVEDNEDQRDILTSVLETEGYQVLTADNGESALEVLAKTNADIIVCDLMMPKMNGEELVRKLRGSEQHELLPVLMLTAVSDEDSEYNLLAAGADDYCSKGTKKKVILKRIERLLARSQNPL